jgi:hypothetical protein
MEISEYVIRAGSVAFVRPQALGDEVIRSGGMSGNFEAEAREIEAALKAQTFIRAVSRTLVNARGLKILVRSGEVEGIAPAFMFGYFALQVALPRKNQDLPLDYEGDVIEDFDVIYDGITFCAIAPAPAEAGEILVPFYKPYDQHFGEQVARLMKQALSKSEKFRPVVLSPSPVHPCMRVVVCLDPARDETALHVSAEPCGSDIRVTAVAAKAHWSADEVAKRVADMALGYLSHFYEMRQLCAHVDLTLEAIVARLQSAAASYSRLTSVRWWQLWRVSRFELIRSIRCEIGAALERHVFLTSLQLALAARADFCTRLLDESRVLGPRGPYFRAQLQEAPEWHVDSVLRALRFYEEETRTSLTAEVAMLAALIAAVVSAVTAGLVQLAG